ncbi:FtsX-like permease family protein [Galbitalea sp. SE-J8]|uniref:ABC transporter permease n=1 Tax=Galbitalea sp. SE-J8 TaxID=3054952 RepID=UPI00259C7CBF|nr:ABC transporter permease [Galbitalea sp. SE-J8]MDM4762818.1 FtsX-like permease family protein [Galbitalea sp. SE-J8]
MLRLALHALAHHWAGSVAAGVAAFTATALLAGCGLLLQTGLDGAVAPERYAGAPVSVSGDQNAHAVEHKHDKVKRTSKPLAERVWMPDRVIDTVRALDTVDSVVPELDFPAYLIVDGRPVPGPHGLASLGHDWSSAALTPFTVGSGRAPSADDEIVIDAALAARARVRPGSTVSVQTCTGPGRYRVVGVAAPGGDRDGLPSQSTLFFSSARAESLTGRPGRVAALGVWPASGVDRRALAAAIRTALADVPVRVSLDGDRGAAEFPAAPNATVRLVSIAGVIGVTSLLVALLVVAGTVSLAIQRRRTEFALLRTIGATPGQVRAMVGLEAATVGLVAALPGGAFGLLVAGRLHDYLVAAGAIPGNLALATGPLPVLAAALLTTAGAGVIGLICGRRAARIRPTAAVAEAAAPPATLGRGRAIAGLLLLAVGAALLFVLRMLHTAAAAVPVMLVTSLICVGAVTLLGVPVIRLIGTAISVLVRGPGAAPLHLAALNLRTGSRRFTSVAMPVLLAVGMACTILFQQTTLAHAADRELEAAVRADYAVSGSDPGLSPAIAVAARRIAGVTTVTQIIRSAARDADLADYSVQGVTPAGLSRTLDLGVEAGSLAALGPDAVALSSSAAQRSGAGVGDRLRLTLGDGTPVTLTVAAVYRRGLGFPDITMAHDVVAAHVDDPFDDLVLVDGRPGLRPAMRAALGAGARVDAHAGQRAPAPAEGGPTVGVPYLLLILIAGFSAIGVVNTLIMATAHRVHEFATLRLAGATPAQIRAMTQWESVLLTITGALLGTAVSLAALWAFSAGMGLPSPFVPAAPYLAIVGGTAALVSVVTVVATRAALALSRARDRDPAA